MYYIGIDFGHGETTVSRAPGYNGAGVSQIAIKQANDNEGKKIVSAVCKKNNQWSLVYGEQDYKSEDVRQGFKGLISTMSSRDKESMREFSKLVFKAILEHDTDLEYVSYDDKNFELGIACPSDWVRQDSNAQKEYLDFFRNECGLPVDHCIKESDAAFFTKYDKYSPDDSVFVIDLGSSTIDFTTYSHSKCIVDCCWGANLGAHIIEDALMPHILKAGRNVENLQNLKNFRSTHQLAGNVDEAISLFVRFYKEVYYSQKQDLYTAIIPYINLTPGWPGKAWDVCIGFEATKAEFEKIISSYMMSIKETLSNAKIRLNLNGITPNRVLLSGGASRMPFIREYAEQIFGVKVDVDQQPECVVSNGIALYAKKQREALNKLNHEIEAMDFISIYKEADRYATADSINDFSGRIINVIKNCTHNTGHTIRVAFSRFLYGLDARDPKYLELFSKKLLHNINERVSRELASIIWIEFSKRVYPDEIRIMKEDLNIQYMNWRGAPEDLLAGKISDWIDKTAHAADIVAFSFTDFNWEKERNIYEVNSLVNGTLSRMINYFKYDADSIAYNNDDLLRVCKDLKDSVIDVAERIFFQKQLFQTTFIK